MTSLIGARQISFQHIVLSTTDVRDRVSRWKLQIQFVYNSIDHFC